MTYKRESEISHISVARISVARRFAIGSTVRPVPLERSTAAFVNALLPRPEDLAPRSNRFLGRQTNPVLQDSGPWALRLAFPCPSASFPSPVQKRLRGTKRGQEKPEGRFLLLLEGRTGDSSSQPEQSSRRC